MFGFKKKNEIVRIDKYQVDKCDEELLDLVKVEDPLLKDRIFQAIPELAKIANKTAKAAYNIKNPLYICDIAPDKLVHSKEGVDFLRAQQMGDTGIVKNGNLKRVNKNVAAKQLVSNVYNVAAIVVGQHYMSEISNELGTIKTAISELKMLSEVDIMSEASTILRDVLTISNNKKEILQNDELRLQEINNLSSFEHRCELLIEKVTMLINNYTKLTINDFNAYSSRVLEIDNLFNLQNGLYKLLNLIAELKYVLYKGAVSKKLCNSKINDYKIMIENSREYVSAWNSKECNIFKIDMKKGEYIKNKTVNKVFSKVAKILNVEDKINEAKIDDNIVDTINNQINDKKLKELDYAYEYKDNLKIVLKNNELYYKIVENKEK